MANPSTLRALRIHPVWISTSVLTLVTIVAILFHASWLPMARTWLARWSGPDSGSESTPAVAEGSHEGHDHEHACQDDADSLQISPQARKNIGLRLGPVELRDFQRTISVPGVVVERPGRSVVEITAPMTGVVTRIRAIQGEAVSMGQPLFELRLTHEELVQAQGDFLRTVEELDVIAREVERLDKVTSSGAVAAKTLLERKYEQQKQQAVLHAQRQALLLHGLTEDQAREIQTTRTLLKNLTVTTPAEDDSTANGATFYQVQQLRVEKGQHVTAGDTLAVLTNHAELFIEGNAFERDVPLIHRAVEQDAGVTAMLESENQDETVAGLKILYLAGNVDVESRAFHFYVTLPNQLLRDRQADGHRFVSWRYKPGQRMQLLIPVETWKDRIVLPAEAVAQDGVEAYVFQANGDCFQRRPVHVEYRDPSSVVVANDGSLFVGDVIALNGAQQVLLALKNKAAGPIDPHAGHNH